jgi:hypothetical protein
MPLPSVFTLASCPALSSTITVLTISSSESRSPSTRAPTSALIMSSRGCSRRSAISART